MKSVHFIGILIILLVTVGSAGADVVLTGANGINPGNVQVNVICNIQNSSIIFLDQSTGVNNPGIAGIAYNLNIDAQEITGYKLDSDTGQVLYGADSNEQDGNRWEKKTDTTGAGEAGNLLRFYSGNTGSIDRFHKIEVKLPAFNGNIPADSRNNQVAVQFVSDQLSTFIAGPGNGGTTAANSALSLEVTASSKTYDSAGQKISYNYVLENEGNVPITGLIVQDGKLGTVSVPSSALGPGQFVSVTAVYTITQADIDAGSVINSAYATGNYNGNQVISNAAVATITADKPALKLEESALPVTYNTAGQTITYTYKVTNSGNIKVLGPITITDNRTTEGTPLVISQNDLAVGDQVVFTKSYTVTDDDLNAGSVTSTAYATGAYNSKQVKSNDATATVTAYKSALTIEGSASPTNYSTEGQKIEYNYLVTNSGNVPITGLKVTDDKLGTVAVSSTTLEPHSSVSVSSTHIITQSDLDVGSVTSQSSATGEFNSQEIRSNIDTVEIKADTQIPEFPSIVLPVVAILGLLLISQRKRKEG